MTDSHHPNPEEEMERAETMKDEEPTKYYAPKMPRRSWSPNPDSETCACHNAITANILDQRFDEKFSPDWWYGFSPMVEVNNPAINAVKAFIHSEIRKALEEMSEQIKFDARPIIVTGMPINDQQAYDCNKAAGYNELSNKVRARADDYIAKWETPLETPND